MHWLHKNSFHLDSSVSSILDNSVSGILAVYAFHCLYISSVLAATLHSRRRVFVTQGHNNSGDKSDNTADEIQGKAPGEMEDDGSLLFRNLPHKDEQPDESHDAGDASDHFRYAREAPETRQQDDKASGKRQPDHSQALQGHHRFQPFRRVTEAGGAGHWPRVTVADVPEPSVNDDGVVYRRLGAVRPVRRHHPRRQAGKAEVEEDDADFVPRDLSNRK